MGIIEETIEYVVAQTLQLNRLHIPDELVSINYSAIFCQSDEEFETLEKRASQRGHVVEDTPTGPLFKLNQPLETIAGPLWLLKIRKPDPTRPQRGDADFTLKDYETFKKKHVKDAKHFKVIDRDNFEMIELRDEKFDVLTYFSSIPLTRQLGIE